MAAAPALGALQAVFEVAAHFAVGGSLFMVLLEHRAHRTGDQALLSFLQDWSRMFLLMSMILGIGLGTGLWTVLAVAQPDAAHALLRIFLWVWGVMSILGILLAAATLLHYSGWGVLPPRHHLALGWIIVVSAWLGLFAVNGVLAFMETPGQWMTTGHFIDGFFNETFNPSMLVQAGASLGTAGLFSLVAGCAAEAGRLRGVLVRTASRFVLAGFALLPAGVAWHAATLSPAARQLLTGAPGIGPVLFYGGLAAAVTVFAFALTGPFSRPEGCTRSFALLLLTLGLGAAVAAGFQREVVRSPHVITGYLYVNGLDPRALPALERRGVLASARYAAVRSLGADPDRAGRELFRLECAACHTVGGFRSIRQAVQGWEPDALDRQLGRLDRLRGSMPPFAGTAGERRALARWLAALPAR